MKKFILSLLRKLVPKPIAGFLGVVQSVISVLREILMVAARICAVLIFWTKKDDEWVARIRKWFEWLVKPIETVKNWLLGPSI